MIKTKVKLQLKHPTSTEMIKNQPKTLTHLFCWFSHANTHDVYKCSSKTYHTINFDFKSINIMLFIYHNPTEKYLDVNKLLFVPLLKRSTSVSLYRSTHQYIQFETGYYMNNRNQLNNSLYLPQALFPVLLI